VLLLVIGLSIYTNHKIKVIGNSEEFLNQIVHAITGMESTDRNSSFESILNVLSPSILGGYPHSMALDFAGRNVQRTVLNNLLNTHPSDKHKKENNETQKEIQKHLNKNITNISSQINRNQFSAAFNQSVANNQSLFYRVRRRIENFRPPMLSIFSRRRPNAYDIILDVIRNGDPSMGFSFYFFWTGCFFHFQALIVGMVNWNRSVVIRDQSLNPS